MAGRTDDPLQLPAEPIDRLVKPLERFLHVEAAGGIVLLACAVIAVILANSPASAWYLGLWRTEVGFQIGSFEMVHSLKHWINDGLMAIFFFVIGLEVKRELVLGELRDLRRAALPIAGAIGGMVVPALLYLALQAKSPAAGAWGIPMATDIAFVVGCMALLGPRIPRGLRVMLLSLAIADDIGAILVIAFKYTDRLDTGALALGFGALVVAFGLSRLGVRNLLVYTIIGVLAWVGFHESGVHATIAGVLIGLMTPARPYASEGLLGELMDRASEVFHGGEWEKLPHRAGAVQFVRRATRESVSMLEFLEGLLHPWVGFLIVPLFALANAGVPIRASAFTEPVAIAVAVGLVIGKPVGIVSVSWLAVRAGLARLPENVTWRAVAGGGCLCGIGFTMAMFIAELAFKKPEFASYLDPAKLGVFGASALSAVIGMSILARLPRPPASPDETTA